MCVTVLKPSGKIQIDDKRFDATCVKDCGPEGSRKEAVRKEGFNLIAEKVV